MFKKGEAVKLKAVVPQGTVAELRFNDEGEVEVLLRTEAGEERWFKQDDLEAA